MTISRNAEYEALYARIAAAAQLLAVGLSEADAQDFLSAAGATIANATQRLLTLRDYTERSNAAARVVNAAHTKPRRGSHANR